jgi:hypothetical protein
MQQDPLRILYGSCDSSNTTSRLDCIHPGFLLGSNPASWALDLDAGKNSHLLANHVWRNGQLFPADQVSTAFAEAKLHRATVGILQRSRVVAKQATVTFAASESDVLLDLLLAQAVPCLLANLA